MRLIVNNFLGVESKTLDLPEPGQVLLITGNNGSGKTSLVLALQAALSREPNIKGFTNAGDRSRYVKAGAESGAVRLEVDQSNYVQLNYSGKGGKPELSTYGEVPRESADVLSARAIDEIAENKHEIKQLLTYLTGAEVEPREFLLALVPTLDQSRLWAPAEIDKLWQIIDATSPDQDNELKAKLKEAGYSGEVIGIAVIYRQCENDGWDETCDELKTRAQSFKSDWRVAVARTGESRNYGTSIAETWRPEALTTTLSQEELLAEIDRLERSVPAATSKTEGEDMLDEEMAEATAGMEKLQEKLAEIKGSTLLFESQLHQWQQLGRTKCPECGAPLSVKGVNLERGVSDEEYAKLDKEHKDQLMRSQEQEAEIGRQLAEAQSRVAALRERKQQEASRQIEAGKTPQKIAELKQQLMIMQAWAEAREKHGRIVRHNAAIEVVRPEGLRAQKYLKKLQELNSLIASDELMVDEKARVSFRGRPIGICSGGERFMADLKLKLIAGAMGKHQFYAFDGADILDQRNLREVMDFADASQSSRIIITATLASEMVDKVAKAYGSKMAIVRL